ncbi:MAG: GspH/FimT family protein [Planctomycetota bacterium]|jgi:general secretion pathway protein H
MPAKRNRNSAGFTLIELLVVVLILAIAAAIIVPNMSGASDIRATAAARIIAADMQYAQNMAITYQTPVSVEFTPNGEYYTLTNASGPLIHPTTKTDYTTYFGSESGFGMVDIVSASFAGNPKVTFDELGAPDNPGSVTIAAGTYTYNIDVAAATGKVTIAYTGS